MNQQKVQFCPTCGQRVRAPEGLQLPPVDERITIGEAAARFKLSKRWLYDHAQAPFVEHPSRRCTLIRVRALDEWLRAHSGTRSLGVSLRAKQKRRPRHS